MTYEDCLYFVLLWSGTLQGIAAPSDFWNPLWCLGTSGAN